MAIELFYQLINIFVSPTFQQHTYHIHIEQIDRIFVYLLRI